MKYQTFVVKTGLPFPLDMLRYDSCFPADSQAALNIEESITRHTSGEKTFKLGRFVRVKSESPTIRRWNSFQCHVSDIEKR